MEKINKILILLIIGNFLLAAPVSQNRAINVAENFFFHKQNPRTNDFNYNAVNVYNMDNNDIFHVVELEPTGFILIAANDVVRPILGYSFENNFSFSEPPVNIKYLFNLYSTEINNQQRNSSTDEFISNEWEKFSNFVEYEGQSRNVGPLLQSRFDQGSGWNSLCPEDMNGPGGRALVGCVAVSMAQVMHYWSYPEIGYGSHSYNHWDYGYQYADFGNAYYDYSQMPNNYATSETQELLYHCGVAVNMGYGADGSGANVFGSSPSTYYAMRNYFLFQNDMDQIEPNDYSTSSQYRAALQNQLNTNKPIIYVGYSDDGGHAWNIDGYDDDYFHNNWGWGGSQNGYFLLSSLNGFNDWQGALIDIEPQSLDNPNVVLQNYTYQESQGDNDGVINPGEIVELYVTVENLIPWDNAEIVDLIISTNDPDIAIINDYVTFNSLNAGNDYTNNSQPFLIATSNDIDLSSHQLQLNSISVGYNGDTDENIYNLEMQVSMEQSGFPYTLTQIDDNGQEYNSMTTVQSSPLVIDINSFNNNFPEIFFGDNSGYFHGVDHNGVPLDGFPVQLEGTSSEIWGSPVCDDIDNDGEIEFIITSKNRHLYIIDQYGNIELDYETDQYLMATPSIANLDNDNFKEIVFYGYTNSGDVFAINHNGTPVNNFPVEINEKILKGGAIYDLNENGLDDIVIATENEKLLMIIYDDGTTNNLFSSSQKFKSSPSIIDYNGEIIITIGDEGGMFYGIKTDGSIAFSIFTDNNVRSSAGFIEIDNQLGIFFGSEDGNLYGIDINGNNLDGWPQDISASTDNNINSSPVFADLDNDGDAEIITASEEGELIIYHLNGERFENYPISFDYGFTSSPTVYDIDNDNDMEIIIGTSQNLSVIDIKNESLDPNYFWYTYRGNNKRDGVYVFNGSIAGDINIDGSLNVQDLVVLINIIIGGNQDTNNNGDINNDNTIDVLDVVVLVNMILQS